MLVRLMNFHVLDNDGNKKPFIRQRDGVFTGYGFNIKSSQFN